LFCFLLNAITTRQYKQKNGKLKPNIEKTNCSHQTLAGAAGPPMRAPQACRGFKPVSLSLLFCRVRPGQDLPAGNIKKKKSCTRSTAFLPV
jgi:hypothetical protein